MSLLTLRKNRQREPVLCALFGVPCWGLILECLGTVGLLWAAPAGMVVVSCWVFSEPVRAWAVRGCSPGPLCPVTLTCTGINVMPPFSLAIPAERRTFCAITQKNYVIGCFIIIWICEQTLHECIKMKTLYYSFTYHGTYYSVLLSY